MTGVAGMVPPAAPLPPGKQLERRLSKYTDALVVPIQGWQPFLNLP